jgi:multidrug efflux pump subunit AcrA (membrane-fusion protein)
MAQAEFLEDPDVQDQNIFIGSIPGKFSRWGLLVGFGLLLVSMGCLFIIIFPSHINGSITITPTETAIPLLSRAEGPTSVLYVRNGDTVKSGQPIGIIESSCDPKEILKLDSILFNLIESGFDPEAIHRTVQESFFVSLGKMSEAYANFLKTAEDFFSFTNNDPGLARIESYHAQLNHLDKILQEQGNLLALLKDEVGLRSTNYERNLYLCNTGVYTQVDYEKSQSLKIDAEGEYQQAKIAEKQYELEINKVNGFVETEIRESRIALSQKTNSLREAIICLFGLVQDWKFNYVLSVPSNGCVYLNPELLINRNIVKGQTIATLIPNSNSSVIGVLYLPLKGAGRVKVGQKVLARITEFPYLQFGTLKGYIKDLSPVPIDGHYIAKVDFPGSTNLLMRKTGHIKTLLTGQARVVVE